MFKDTVKANSEILEKLRILSEIELFLSFRDKKK